jgi:hypothetical protein
VPEKDAPGDGLVNVIEPAEVVAVVVLAVVVVDRVVVTVAVQDVPE